MRQKLGYFALGRAPYEPLQLVCTMRHHRTTELLVIRHGETVWNGEGRIQGHRDSPLSERGVAQSQRLGERMKGERPEAVVSSDLARALHTAAPVASAVGLSIVIDRQWRERSYGALEGKTWSEIERDHPAEHARLTARDPHFRPEGGESAIEFRERVMEAFGMAVERARGGRIAVVTHGGALGVLYREAKRLPFEAPRDYTLYNASVNRFVLDGAGLRLEQWGDIAHLDGLDADAATGHRG